MISENDRELLKRLLDIPLEERPYLAIARELGLTEEEIIGKIRYFIRKGVFRRFALSLNHRKCGIMGNTLCMAKVPEKHIAEIGRKISEDGRVTHCYSRSGLAYNLYFMVHGKDPKESEAKATQILAGLGLKNYELLSSIKEYKKTSFLI